MSGGLKPCPFCGGEGLAHRVPTGWRVSCEQCGAQPRPGFPSDNEAAAITAWNTRTDTNSDLLEALERLSRLTPAAANARDAHDLHLTARAIAETAISKHRALIEDSGHE